MENPFSHEADDSGIAAPVVTFPESTPEDTTPEPEPPESTPEDPESESTPEDPGEAESERRPRGWLETDLGRAIDAIKAGEIEWPADRPLTPHFLARAIATMDSLPKPPSTGAVAAVLARWVAMGYAVYAEGKPLQFGSVTPRGVELGLAVLRDEWRAHQKAARAAAKAAAEQSA